MHDLAGYRVIELLGQGTSGVVWRALSPGRRRREVAIKQVRPASTAAAVRRFREEADTLSELDHPHIVTVLDVIEVDAGGAAASDLAIVMALARGGSLRTLLDEQRRLSPGEVVALLAPVADAVGSAHRRGVVHGDLKPENVLLTSDGEPLVADFGAARHLSSTSSPVTEGTPGYLDGRVLAGAATDEMSDIYAIAVMACEALSGRRPADGEPTRLLSEDASVPAALAEVLDAAMSPSVDQRPATAEDLCFALRCSVPGDRCRLPGPARRPMPSAGVLPGPAATRRFGPRPPVVPDGAPRPRRRRAAAVAAGAALVVVAAAGARLWIGAGAQAPAGEAAARPATSGKRCPDTAPLDIGVEEEAISGDLTGNGCAVRVGWDGSTARVRLDPDGEVLRVTFTDDAGRPLHGQLLLGDWNGDGADSPALYLPGTGEVVTFDRLAGEGEAVRRVATATGVRSGTAEVVPGRDGYETVEVSPSA